MKYLSVCSGIEAATAAWHPLGWQPVGFSEIEPFPCAVLAHHYGSNLPGEPLSRNGVPNFGDMEKFRDWPDADVDVLVGGTPCQSFSVAGLRKGLADPRGNLALTFLALADRYRPEWLIWENVPGVLSLDEGRAFGSILGGMAELGYWFSYRVLDAQYVRVDEFGRAVPQRRRRVFVVGNSRDWRRAAAVFFEPESLSGNTPPRRQAGQGVAPTISARPTGGGGLGTDFDCDGGLIADTVRSHPRPGSNSLGDIAMVPSTGDVAHCLNAGAMGRIEYETETMIAHALRGEGHDASEDGTGRGTPIVPVVAASLTRGAESSGKGGYAGRRQEDDVNIIAFAQNQRDEVREMPVAGALAAEPGMKQQTYIAAIQERAICENPEAGPDGAGYRDDGAAYTMEARTVPQAVAFDMRGREGGSQFEGPHDTANIRAASGGSSKSYVSEGWAVRRLMVIECERLQGFKDNFTNVLFRGKPGRRWPPLQGARQLDGCPRHALDRQAHRDGQLSFTID